MGMLFPFLSLFALGSFSSAGVLYVNAPLPFKDSGVRQQRFNDGAALSLGIFSNEHSRSLAQSNSPLGFAASRSDE